MSATPSLRRLSIAITAAVAAVTLAIGVTAASLLGWLRPPDTASPPPSPMSTGPVEPTDPAQPATAPALPAEPAVPAGELVVSPDDVTLVMHDDEHEHEHEHDRDKRGHEHDGDDDD